VATGRVALGTGYLPRHAVPDVGGVRYPMCAAALHVVVAYALPAGWAAPGADGAV